jgi:hypothetical protein
MHERVDRQEPSVTAEVTAGWIAGLSGLGGALVGAAGAIWASWLQRKHEEKRAREEREAARHDAAYDDAVQAVLKVKDFFRRKWRDVHEDDWEHQLYSELDRLRLAALSFTSPDLRERLEEGAETLRAWQAVTHMRPNRSDRPRLVNRTVEHLLTVLGDYRRGETIPEPTEEYAEAREAVFLYIEEQEDMARHYREPNR